MRQLKIFGVVVAAVLALGVLAAAALVLSVDPNAYRGEIERLAEQKTGRALQIGGSLDLRLFPHLAISIADVQLGNPPGYEQSPFLSVRRASVGVRLLPILHKRLEVSRLVLDGVTVNLVSRSATDNNWKDLTASRGGNASEGGRGGGAGAPACIAGVEISNASLVYRDEAKKSTTTLTDLRLQTGAVSAGEPVDVSLEFDYGNGGSRPVAHVSVSGVAKLPNESSMLTVRELDVHGSWSGSAPSGSQPVAFSVRSPSVQIDTQTQTLAPAILTAQAGAVSGKLTARADKLFADRIVTGTLMVLRLDARKALASLGIMPPATRDPNALAAFSFACEYRLTPKQLQLMDLSVTLDDTQIRGSATVKDLDKMALSYALHVDRIDADRYLPPQSAPPSGRGTAPPPQSAARSDAQTSATSLPIDALRKLDVQGDLEVGQATLRGLAFSGMSLPVTAKEGRVHLGPAQAQLLDGAYNGDMVLDAAPAQAHLSLNQHLKGVDVGALMQQAFDTTRLSGRGDANIVLAGTGNTYASILRSLVGKIDFNVNEGALNGIDLSYELRRAQALLSQQPLPLQASPARTLFNTFSGSANLDAGVLRNDDLSIETDYLKTHGKGTLDLGTKRGAIAAIDYRLIASVYEVPPPGARGAQGDAKVADIPLKLTGNLGNLKIHPDLEALAAAKVRQEVSKRLQPGMGQPEMGQGKGDTLKQLGDRLKSLLGH